MIYKWFTKCFDTVWYLTDGCSLKMIGRLCLINCWESFPLWILNAANIFWDSHRTQTSYPGLLHAAHDDGGEGGDPEGRETVAHVDCNHGDRPHGVHPILVKITS